MLWSGSSPMAVVRAGMWGFLLFAAAAWLAIGWSVLRLEPADIARLGGTVILFGALTEAVRALAGTRTWWLNAGMAALFAATGVVLLADQDSSFTTPAALIGWYLMVRGAADVAVSMMTRDSDRIWGLLTVVGVLQTLLGFFAASPWSRTGDLVVTVLGALGVLRGVADLVAALRLREAPAVRTDLLDLPPERAAGVAGYAVGLTDYDTAPRWSGPRHSAPARTGDTGLAPAAGLAAETGREKTGRAETGRPETGRAEAGRPESGRVVGGRAEGGRAVDPASIGRPAAMAATEGAGPEAGGDGTTAGDTPAGGERPPAVTSFHDEVLRTTADLDAMLALAGVTGAAVGAGLAVPDEDLPEVPDTPEGVEAAERALEDDEPLRSLADTAEIRAASES